MTLGKEAGSLGSEPASALGSPTIWSLWGTRGWLDVERCQLCLQDTSHSPKQHWRAAVGHWVSLCMMCCRLIVYQDGNYLQPIGQYSQTICRLQIMMLPP